ncbi:MAG: fumarylacetoacetate hydrolase family protein [Candidatus Marinimicrobia bacterium]|nr:fumarylacetoacetate hydrolase family protein [Candidatus Neomarinimicrobiota bacterium]MBT3618099.1 fumarylacetoacetate hydrolase family protein [Candidatus Neomarinimicrobiota bacterium]MBT3828444.1 fumarylacetoacetate hydrolase family protein [Candidatus Neomarinimicrobiota bacterium]MBT3998085.1 fumarylacetoacetate hydrolase family protein [Candidatus Neomarinimicrobiota bacterium]MBT4280211.1 fumarylacetoacetate hydrolase family protein [Candidatus Neomarinimicrobiota bacterium]
MVVDVLRAAIYIHESSGSSEFLSIPSSLKSCLKNWNTLLPALQNLDRALPDSGLTELLGGEHLIAQNQPDVKFLPPVNDPATFRDFYVFEQHVKAARKGRGLDMHPSWYEFPVFYYSNPVNLFGHKEGFPFPNGCEKLDFELELAIITANGGKDISAKDADTVIGGYTILNDWSARDFQKEEMVLNMGPAKGKDFGSCFGPYMVTPDELADAWDSDGKLQLSMTVHVNGKQLSDGNANDMYHSWGDIIERASRNTQIVAGEYIGSGTVGTGCIMELKPENTGGWIQKGDVVRLEIERLGVLENKVI